MFSSASALFVAGALLLSGVATANDVPVVNVLVPVTVRRGERRVVDFRPGVVLPVVGAREQVAVNAQSRIERPVSGMFVLRVQDDSSEGIPVTEAEYRRLLLLQDRFLSRSSTAGRLFTAHRTIGGYSPATVDGIIFHPDGDADAGGRRPMDLYVSFADFRRSEGNSQGDPVLGPHGFETITYYKQLRIADVEAEGTGSPRVLIEPGDGRSYELEAMALPVEGQIPDPRSQRFVLDFGKHPFHGKSGYPEITDSQLLYRVYVARTEGNDAIVVRPDSLRALERAKEGERVSVHYYRIPLRLLRVAPKGAEGDRLLQQAGLNFVRDVGIAQKQYGEAGMDAFFRANRAVGGTVDSIAGASMGDSILSLSRSLSAQARPERPARPGPDCQGRLADLGGT